MAVFWQLLTATVGAVLALWLLVTLVRTRRPVRRTVSSFLQGASALAAVNVSGILTGVSLGLNWLSLGVCAALGVPGVIGLLLLKVIFGI